MAQTTHPFVKIVEITPSLAERWLGRNHEDQRNIRTRKVAEYAADMKAGRWVLSNQVIAFNKKNELVNGQHTLKGVIESGCTIKCICVWNLSDMAILVMDSGIKRSTDDHFAMAKLDFPKGCGATVRRALESVRDVRRAISDLQVKDFMDEYGVQVRFVHSVAKKHTKFFSAPVKAALVRARIARVPEDKITRFVDVLETGIMRPGEDAAVKLRNYIVEKHQNANSGKARMDLYGLTEAALAAFLKGETVRTLRPAAEEQWPFRGETQPASQASSEKQDKKAG